MESHGTRIFTARTDDQSRVTLHDVHSILADEALMLKNSPGAQRMNEAAAETVQKAIERLDSLQGWLEAVQQLYQDEPKRVPSDMREGIDAALKQFPAASRG